jgi:hypothetical protein
VIEISLWEIDYRAVAIMVKKIAWPRSGRSSKSRRYDQTCKNPARFG